MFTLKIECSKEIDELSIKFSDGSVSMVAKDDSDVPDVPDVPDVQSTSSTPSTSSVSSTPISLAPEKGQSSTNHEQILDTDASWGSASNEVVEKPVIPTRERAVNIASELQNLDL